MRRFLAALLATLFAASSALADDSALNKEGFWTVGRGAADSKGCLASIANDDKVILFIQVAAPDHVQLAVGTKGPMRRGKQGVLAVGDERFNFEPTYGDTRDLVFLEGLPVPALAALRKARWVSVIVDGREIMAVSFDKTGVEGALDAVVACAKGESGWWGPGLGAPATVAGANGADEPADRELVYQAEDAAWGILTEKGHCIAQAAAPDDRFIQLLAVPGKVGLAIGSKGERLPKARKVRVETDSYRFEFKPEYTDEASYMNSADPLDSADAFALRRAKRIRMTADGRDLIDVELEGDGLAGIMDAVTACAAGEKGWWGEGAKQP